MDKKSYKTLNNSFKIVELLAPAKNKDCAITAILFTSISLIKSNKATKILAGIINLICSLIMALMIVACFNVTFDRLKYISNGNPGFGIFLSTIGVVSVFVTSICILATKDRKTSKKDSSKKK